VDPQQYDGGAPSDNFFNVLQDALIKNFRDEVYDHLALAERYELAKDAKSATLWLRRGHQARQWRLGHIGRRQVELRALPRRLGRECCTTASMVSGYPTTTPSVSTSRSRSSIFRG
jgi:hypothetical protein